MIALLLCSAKFFVGDLVEIAMLEPFWWTRWGVTGVAGKDKEADQK